MLERLERRLAGAISAACAVGLAALCGLVLYAVVLRFVFSRAPYWSEELPRLVLAWTAFLGAAVCVFRDSHLKAGLLPLLVRGPLGRRLAALLGDLAALVFLAVIGRAGWQVAMMTMGQPTTALQVPAGLFYLALPAACLAMGAFLVARLARGWRS